MSTRKEDPELFVLKGPNYTTQISTNTNINFSHFAFFYVV